MLVLHAKLAAPSANQIVSNVIFLRISVSPGVHMYMYQVRKSLAFYHCVTGHLYSCRYVSQVAVLAEVVAMKQLRGI